MDNQSFFLYKSIDLILCNISKDGGFQMTQSNALDIANALVLKSHEAGSPISNMKLQKLVYFAYGWFAAIEDRELFSDEIQAWKFGPVIPSLYHKFKLFYSNPIPKDHFFSSSNDSADVPKGLIDKIWEVYGSFSAEQLVARTHEPGTPWDTAYSAGINDIVINKIDIKRYFQGLLTN
jgi:uncharacterized phage-associated protein